MLGMMWRALGVSLVPIYTASGDSADQRGCPQSPRRCWLPYTAPWSGLLGGFGNKASSEDILSQGSSLAAELIWQSTCLFWFLFPEAIFTSVHLRMNRTCSSTLHFCTVFLCAPAPLQFSRSVVSDCDPRDCSMPDFPVHHQLLEHLLRLPEDTSDLPHCLAWEEGSVCSYCGQLPNDRELLASSAFFLRGLSSFLPKAAFRKSQYKMLCGEGRPVSGWMKPSPLNAKNNLS